MQTKNLIQTTANVIRITNLKKGDIVKQISEEYSRIEVYYAVVLDLLNSGNKCFVQLLRYKEGYGEITAEIVIYAGDKDLSIFPTTKEEASEFLLASIKSMDKAIIKDKEELHKKIEGLKTAKEFVSGELSRNITDVEYSEITQGEYNEEVKRIDEKKKELESL